MVRIINELKEEKIKLIDEIEKMIDKQVKEENYIDLIQWLYNNYRNILREYEKTKGNLQVEFLK